MSGSPNVIVYWPYRRERIVASNRSGPCSPYISIPPRRAAARIERGRVRGFYMRYRLPAEVAGIVAAERAERKRIRDLIQPYMDEIDASTKRERSIRRQYIDSLEPPTQLTDENGARWRFKP